MSFIKLDSLGSLVDGPTGEIWDPDRLRKDILNRANYFKDSGLQPGQKIILMHSNTVHFFIDLFGLWLNGICVACSDPKIGLQELNSLIELVEPSHLVVRGGFSEKVSIDELKIDWIDTQVSLSHPHNSFFRAASINPDEPHHFINF